MMVIFGLASLRGCALNFTLFSQVLEKGLPSWTVIQNWILRFGLYKLLQPLQRRTDWIWIIDQTIEFGTKKCLAILAVSLETFRNNQFVLRHNDMEIAAISIAAKATGKHIGKLLTSVGKEIGKPVQIVSDNGSNIKSGIKTFLKHSSRTIHTYDITHKAAGELKRVLGRDRKWTMFCRKLVQTKRRVIHTKFAFLAPRKQRDKSRWQNLQQNLVWAERVLAEKPMLTGRPGRPTNYQRAFRDHFGWLADFEADLRRWRMLLDVVTLAQVEVKTNGLSTQTADMFMRRVLAGGIENKECETLALRLADFFIRETASFEPGQVLLGSSDIIESIFGKYKLFSAKTPLKEIGSSILTLPILTSDVTLEEVKQAMETISAKSLSTWLAENVGETLLAKRRKVPSYSKPKYPVKYFTPVA